ncbi:MAG: class I SAM-dependent methyltransferase [Nitrospirota bacterium]|jgi:ubiquinone/menaquinone biosynthesis C-methylase UbiE
MHKFDPKKIDILISEERKKELDPSKYLKEKGLKKGMAFADIGCGPGFFVFPASEIVGKTGRVYALDTQQEMLNELKKRRPSENIIILKSEETELPVQDKAVDIAIMVFVLHEVHHPVDFLKEVKRILKPSGRLIVIDWEKKVEEKGPPFEERIPKEKAETLFQEAGFEIIGKGNLNPSHYEVAGKKG